VAEARKIDPFDVEALEKSLNDSATRVSTIWVSFLIFSLYLLTAATTVTHRQLFLAEPVKLPVLNIELPLWGFFWLAPILFVIFHAYVLIQLILLARTAAAYDAAVAKLVEHDNLSPEANASLRQRLANTLFGQILAGSPREREGGFGSLLKAMACITLVIAPILILLTFQFMFLPYHSHVATWTHRLLILLEFVVAFKLWPLVLNPQRDFRRPNWRWRIRKAAVGVTGLFGSSESAQRARQGLRRQAAPMGATALFILLSLSLATFPGEPHVSLFTGRVNLFTGQGFDDVQCRRWLQQKFEFADMRFDRLALARVDVVDHDKLEKIRQATSNAGERPYQGERARILRDRDLNCGDFSDYADLRRLDLSGAYLRNADFRSSKLEGISFTRTHLHGALLKGAKLQGASLDDARLQGASLDDARLQGASLKGAKLQGASLDRAELQGASLIDAELQGASFDYAWLQGASLGGAQLQGAFLSNASLQGASLYGAQLQGAFLDNAWLAGAFLDEAEFQGASLVGAELQGASLNRARLQGASLNEAQLQSASLVRAQLQGTSLDDANLDDALLSSAWIWRARGATCTNARIVDLKNDAVITDGGDLFSIEPIPATAEQIEKFVTQWIAEIPEERRKRDVRKILNERLTVAGDDTAALGEPWRSCGSESREISQDEFDRRHVAVLREPVCDAERNGAAIGEGIAHNWISKIEKRRKFSAKLAQALLGEDSKPCAPAKDYDQKTKELLREAAGPAPATIPPK
jgi:uncharacterized protein YjbI with pentapeptide repeats